LAVDGTVGCSTPVWQRIRVLLARDVFGGVDCVKVDFYYYFRFTEFTEAASVEK